MRFSSPGRELVHDVADVHPGRQRRRRPHRRGRLRQATSWGRSPPSSRTTRRRSYCPDGSIHPGIDPATGDPIDSRSAFQMADQPEDVRTRYALHACPGQGSCGGMFTYNTMQMFIGAFIATPSTAPQMGQVAQRRARLLLASTAEAMSQAEFNVGSPSARPRQYAAVLAAYSMVDRIRLQVRKELLDADFLDGSALTVQETLAGQVALAPPARSRGHLHVEKPFKDTLRAAAAVGNSAPGAILKVAGVEGGVTEGVFSGRARVFNGERDLIDAPDHHPDGFSDNDMVVIRCRTPRPRHARNCSIPPRITAPAASAIPGHRPRHRRPLLGRFDRTGHRPCGTRGVRG